MIKIPELQIIESIKEGNKDAFGQLFKEHFPSLLIYARNILGNTEIARDVIQDIFLKLWEKREQIKITSSLKSFLYSTVYNSCIDFLRRSKAEKKIIDLAKIQLSDIERTYLDKVLENDRYLIDQKIQIKINKAIENLPEQCRIIFKMSRFDKLRNKEIAEKLNLSVRTVDTQIFRALKSLREQLDGTYKIFKSLYSLLVAINQIGILKS